MSPYRAFLESLEKHRKGLVRLLLLLLVNAAVFGAVTYRLANKQNRLSEDLQRFSFVLAQKKGELERLSVAEVRATSNAAAVAEFWDDVVKPRVPGLTEAWDEIDRLAGATKVLRGRTSYERDFLDVGLEQIKATMPVEGDYFDLVRFINRLERSERFFLVEQVRLSRRDSDDRTIRLDCSISFYLKGPA